MFCSTIIPTINRPTLSRAVRSVLEQDFREDGFEVIVANDSGKPLPDMDWQHAPNVRVIETHRRERCVARNSGAGVAAGRYLHFLDDDDILLPGAIHAFWDNSRASDASWLYGYWQTVDNAGKLVDEFRPELDGNVFALLVAGEGLPLQASLLRAEDFFAAGGFDSRPAFLGVEDRDLGRRLALRGAISFVPAVVAQVRIGICGSSTNWSALAEGDRRGREKALGAVGAFSRLRSSAHTNYWRGRLCRAIAGSILWNLHRMNLLTVASRTTSGLLLTGSFVFSGEFWRGLRTRIQ
jgi:GT2 family glycosyltransferase